MKSHIGCPGILEKRGGGLMDCYRKASKLKAVKTDHIIKSKSYGVRGKSIMM